MSQQATPQTHEIRNPKLIIKDLMSFVGLNESGYDERAEQIKHVMDEASQYLDKAKNKEQAWERLERLSASVHYDSGL